jgi:hypothetical protein
MEDATQKRSYWRGFARGAAAGVVTTAAAVVLSLATKVVKLKNGRRKR